MSKYIDADKLIAEIGRFQGCAKAYLYGSERQSELSPNQYRMEGAESFCLSILSIIDSLQKERQEVDLVAEYDEQFYSDPVYGKLVNRNAGIAIARHFYSLGLKAGKEK